MPMLKLKEGGGRRRRPTHRVLCLPVPVGFRGSDGQQAWGQLAILVGALY